MKKRDRLVRYSAPERINHWIVAFCFVLAALSGLGFFFPSFNWLMHVLGTPQLARILHPFVGVVMFAAFLIMFLRYWKQNLINREDLLWAKNINKIVRNEEVGDTGKYNFGQKCVFWAAIISLVLLLASGVVIWRPYFAGAFAIPLIRAALVVHSVSAVALIVVIMVHIYAALWVKGTITA
ncbi:formate dehydrogenase cytochrome b556 subunit, partial [Pantoea sp. CTOTU50773]